MANQFRKDLQEKSQKNIQEEEYALPVETGNTPRWVPAAVMAIAVVSFSGLAWYAYNAGSRSVQEEDLILVEADASPTKEKPLDPGGMRIPNQDKSIFGVVSGTPMKPVGGEQLAPAPEEPVSAEQLASAQQDSTQTWVNEKLQQQQGQAETLLTPPSEPGMPLGAMAAAQQPAVGSPPELDLVAPVTPTVQPQQEETEKPSPAAIAAAAAPPSTAPKVETVISAPATTQTASNVAAPVELTPPPAQPLVTEKPETTVEKVADETRQIADAVKEKVASVKPSAGAAGTVQLGAYRSESEAKTSWGRISKKFSTQLSGADSNIIKADLGAKGVFYRLRVKVADAKGTCATLSAQSQPCMVVK